MCKKAASFCLAIFIACGLGLNPATAQETDSAQSADMAAMMEMWEKMAEPVAQHQQLAEMVGVWDATLTMWAAPGAPPMNSSGVGTFSMILGGRYLKHDFEGSTFGTPYKGLGITGYDKFREEYFDLWFDDMSTGVMISRGVADSTGKVFHYTGKMDDPMAGMKDMPVRSVYTIIDDDTRQMEMYVPDGSGGEFKSMEIVYQRRK